MSHDLCSLTSLISCQLGAREVLYEVETFRLCITVLCLHGLVILAIWGVWSHLVRSNQHLGHFENTLSGLWLIKGCGSIVVLLYQTQYQISFAMHHIVARILLTQALFVACKSPSSGFISYSDGSHSASDHCGGGHLKLQEGQLYSIACSHNAARSNG